MNKSITRIFGAVVILLASFLIFNSNVNVTSASETCPDGGGWTKIDSGDLSLYPVAGATQYCFKAGNWPTVSEIPGGGFGQEGSCREDIKNCDLSHWSYFKGDCEVCDQSEWSCRECQLYPPDNECRDNFMGYCSKTHGCELELVCEDRGPVSEVACLGDCQEIPDCRMEWVCEDTCGEDPTPTPTPTPTDEPTPTPTGDPTPVPTPVDVCANIDGIQTSVPGGLHLDASGRNCVDYEYGGPEPSDGGIGGGQVLGASTMAETGSAQESIFYSIFVLGSIFTSLGIMKNGKKNLI